MNLWLQTSDCCGHCRERTESPRFLDLAWLAEKNEDIDKLFAFLGQKCFSKSWSITSNPIPLRSQIKQLRRFIWKFNSS